MRRILKAISLVVALAFVALAASAVVAQEEQVDTRISIAPLFVDGKIVEDNVVYVNAIYIEGAVTSQTGIASLRWRNDRGGNGDARLYVGKLGEANLNGKWYVPRVPLALGVNTITIEAVNLNGEIFSERVIVYRR